VSTDLLQDVDERLQRARRSRDHRAAAGASGATGGCSGLVVNELPVTQDALSGRHVVTRSAAEQRLDHLHRLLLQTCNARTHAPTRHGTGSLGHRVNGPFGSSFTSESPGHHFDLV